MMKNNILLLLLIFFFFFGLAHAQKPDESAKDTIVQIDGDIYELKTWSQYQVVKDTTEMHSRIVSIDTAIVEPQRERALLVTKISYFEANKMSAFRTARPAPLNTKKQPATKKKN